MGKLFPLKSCFHKEKEDKDYSSDLWHREKLLTQPVWNPIINQLTLPLDWAIDKTIVSAFRNIKILHMLQEKEDRTCFFHMHDWVIDRTISRTASNAVKGCQMEQERLKTCLDMLEWTREDLKARNANCLDQIRTRNPYLSPPPMKQPCPMWCVDPKAAEYLDKARDWAERADQGLELPKKYHFKGLTYEQISELMMGLELLDIQFETKYLERACVEYVHTVNRSRTWIKLALIIPALIFAKGPKRLPWQISFPIAGILCLVRAAQLYLRAGHEVYKTDKRATNLLKYSNDLSTELHKYSLAQEEKETARAKDQFDQLRKKYQEASKKVDRFHKKADQLSESVHSSSEAINNLENSIAQSDKEIDGLRESVACSTETIHSLKETVARSDENIDSLQKSMKELIDTFKKMKNAFEMRGITMPIQQNGNRVLIAAKS